MTKTIDIKKGLKLELSNGVWYLVAGHGKSALVNALSSFTSEYIEKLNVKCSWYLMCTNNASELVKHPVLGEVLTCKRCAERAR